MAELKIPAGSKVCLPEALHHYRQKPRRCDRTAEFGPLEPRLSLGQKPT
jgi:hypothetical protein